MPDPLRLLVLAQDPTLFEQGKAVPGDARRRHIRYAQVMRDMLGEDSEIRMITYTTRKSGQRMDDPEPGLKLYGTASLHRATYLFDCARISRRIIGRGWAPTAITTQTPWEEGQVGAALARRLGARFLPQLHFDLFSPEWGSETLLNRWRARVGARILSNATRVRAVSQPLAHKLTDQLKIDPQQIDVIPVGVNFQPSTLSVEAAKAALDPRLIGKPVVLFVGRLVSQKNLRLWLDVAVDVLAQLPQTRFVIVGKGEEEKALRATVVARRQEESILFIGSVGHERLPDVYRAADLLLLSSHYEGFGRVVLEAAFAGVPSVATRCAGPEDIIEDGVSGILVDKGDRRAMVRSVRALLCEEPSRRAMGRAAFASAHARFGLDSLAAKLVAHWSRT